MQPIVLDNISFQYDSSPEYVFSGLSMSISPEWKTAVVGRNGRGKSTLLQLIHGSVQPRHGVLKRSIRTGLFPGNETAVNVTMLKVIERRIAPFEEWEQRMDLLLSKSDERSLNEYHELFERYARHHGFDRQALIAKECTAIGLDPSKLAQPYNTLSGGEQTRAHIVALFLQPDIFPLLDEPTNHLDMQGRELLGSYLAKKDGFIIVSHDRHVLDLCCDHVIAINKNDVRVFQGTYSSWRTQLLLEEESETARQATLNREISALEEAARKRRSWSLAAEKEKNSAADSGFVSHKPAKVMKRALAAERRRDERIEEKKKLLKNKETVRPLLVHTLDHAPEILVSIENADIEAGGSVLLRNFSLTLRKHERIAIIGPNGSGKTTILNVVRGVHPLKKGIVRVPGTVRLVNSYQQPLWHKGMLREHLQREGIDETQFRISMGSFNIQGEIFERPLETFSYGERKKIDLCRSFLFPHHLLVWDEPVNYIDIESREQIESVILASQPTMLFVEHDRAFVDSIATNVIQLP